VPGKGHQVCPAFFECQPLVDFVATAAGRKSVPRKGVAAVSSRQN
jgi:hypothetical protein